MALDTGTEKDKFVITKMAFFADQNRNRPNFSNNIALKVIWALRKGHFGIPKIHYQNMIQGKIENLSDWIK